MILKHIYDYFIPKKSKSLTYKDILFDYHIPKIKNLPVYKLDICLPINSDIEFNKLAADKSYVGLANVPNIEFNNLPVDSDIEFNNLPVDSDIELVEHIIADNGEYKLIKFINFGYGIKKSNGYYLDLEYPTKLQWDINSVDFIKNCISNDFKILNSITKKTCY